MADHLTRVQAEALSKVQGAAQPCALVQESTLRVPPEPLAPEDWAAATEQPTVPGYEILGVLGRGGMGIVYRARQVGLNRIVALKMILAGIRAGATEVARFRAEAQAQARLQHAHIVQIYEVGETPDGPYFALEYVEGGSLHKQLGGKPQPVLWTAELVETLARAVHHAHQRGLVHRDLKPANVLLAVDGNPKITDFGLAKRLQEEAGWSKSGDLLGTPCYMAPEQAGSKTKGIGPAVDVYALGVILYEMLTGRPPFLAETTVDTLLQVRTQEPVPLRRLRPKLPRDLETICLKYLQKDPGNRYADATVLADDLRSYRFGEPIQARPASWGERLWRWSRRNPALAGASGLAAGALAAACAVTILFAFHQAQANNQLNQAAQHVCSGQRERRDALKLAKEQYALATERHRKAECRLAEIHLDRGLALCEQDEMGRGLLWLARGLEITPADAADLQRVFRANLAGWQRHVLPLRLALEHQGAVMAVAFSPDGRTLLTGSSDGRAQFWDAATGQPVGPPLHHEGIVGAVAFSPDGKTVATGSADGTAQLWDVVNGQRLRPPLQHDGPVYAAAFSPDGATLATGGQDRTVRLWNVATGKSRGNPLRLQGIVNAIAFSPNGKIIATGGRDKLVRLWDVAASKVLDTFFPHSTWVVAVAFSHDWKTLLTASQDGLAQLWDVAEGKDLGKPLAHKGAVTSVAFSADGKFILTGNEDRTARLWDAVTGKPLGSPFCHGGCVRAVAFRPDGRTILTGSSDKTARVWDAVPAKPIGKRLRQKSWVQAAAFSPDGTRILTGGNVNLGQLWRVAHDHAPELSWTLESAARIVVFSTDGKTVLMGGNDGTIRLRRASTGESLPVYLKHPHSVWATAMSQDGRTFFTACQDGVLRSWDMATGEPLDIAVLATSPILAMTISPDGKTLLTGTKNGMAQMWDVTTSRPVSLPLRHEGPVLAVAFSRDGKTIMTGAEDGTARLWDTATGKSHRMLFAHAGPVRAVAFSPDGGTVLTGSQDCTARLWDVATGKPFGPPFRHARWVWTASFSPEGKTILTGSGGGLERGGEACLWSTHVPLEGDVPRIVLSTQVLTGMELDDDGGVRVLDAAKWHCYRQGLEKLGGQPRP